MSKRRAVGVGLRAAFVGLGLAAAACSAVGDVEKASSSVQEALTLTVPYRVRAIDFTAFSDSDTLHEGNCGSGPVDQQTVSDNGVTCGVGYTKPGEWLEYSLQVANAGKFDFISRVAGNATGKTFRLSIDGVVVGGSQSVPSTGWTAFADRQLSDVALTAGSHTLRVLFETGDTNLNYIDVTPGTVTLPQRVEAENYQRAFESTPATNSGTGCNRGDGVDKDPTSDNAGGCLVGWATAGEWLEYDVTVPQAGLFDFTARLAAAVAGRTLQLNVDGASIGTLTAPSAGYTAFDDRKLPNVSLSAGSHVVRALFVQGDLNLNYLDISVHPVVPGYSFGGTVNYNAFVFQDLSLAPSAAGPVAAGRDVLSQGFSYNTLAAGTIGSLAGRNFTGTSGNVQRDLVYGTALSLTNVTVAQGTSRKASPLDFVAEKATLDLLSANLANLTANGTTGISPSGTIFTFTGTDPSRNVFSVNGALLAAGDQFNFSVPATSTAIVNVTGTGAVFDSASIQLGALTPGHLVWNFPQATTVRVNSAGAKGTLLAVNAATTMTSASLDGVLLAGSLSGSNTGITWQPFNGSLTVCSAAALSFAPGSPQLAGTSLALSATATCADNRAAEFHYDYFNSVTDTTWHEVAPGFGTATIPWNTSTLPAGSYQVRVLVRRVGEAALSGASATSSIVFDVPVLIPIAAPTIENFNGLGGTQTGAPPSGWRIDKQVNPRTVGTFTAATYKTDFLAGALLAAASGNGIYNFGAGVANAQAANYWMNSTDRAPGWLSGGSALSSGGTKSGNLYVALRAPVDKDITSLNLGYDIEKYSNGTNPSGFRVQAYSSIDGTSWASLGSDFLRSFAANATNLGFDPAPGQTLNVPAKKFTASIPRNTLFYLAWNYTVDSATSNDGSNAEALAIDNVTIQGSDVCIPNCTGKTCGGDGCGGICGQLCTGPGCVLNSDCQAPLACTGVPSGATAPSVCQPLGYPSTCADGARDGDETDVDCGGSCNTCQTGGGCAADTDCASDLVCGDNNSACFGKARAHKVCWKPSCALGSDVGGCGLDNSPCGKNCSCDDICDSKNPNSVCPPGEVCKADAGRLFGSPSPDACVDPICPSNDPNLCGTTSSLCGQECICTANCAGATCANPDDHCGGQCPGVCGAGQTGCTSTIQCPIGQSCLPQGDGSTKACVPKSCEGIVLTPPLCGSAGAPCGAQCPTCTPQCDGRQCGADPNCGQSCGTCAAGSYCAADGQCIVPTVEPPVKVPDGNGGQKDVPLLVSTQPTAKLGALAGQFSVSDAGTALYSIPFEVPPGRAGVQPALSLSYVSSKANGEEGVGWHLDGLPKITRCPRSYGIDGYAAPIKNDKSDLFCLDGKRLEVKPGQIYGDDGAEYHTLIDSFGEIKSYWDAGDGIQLDLAPNLQRVPRGDRGPDRFVVRTKDGKTLTFGTTRDSLVLARNGIRYAWLIKRVEDRAGNYMTVSYENYHANLVQFDQMMSNMVRPSSITYTGHGSNVGSQHIIFEYSTSGERKDSLLTFGQGGAANVVPDRLKKLSTYASGKAIKNYVFHYPDGELSQIDSVQECAGSDQSVCKPATTFGYKTDQGFTLGSQPIAPSDVQSAGRFDTDGDGRPDYLVTNVQQNAVDGSTALVVAKVSADVAVAVGSYFAGGVGGFAINTFWNLAKGGFWGLFGQSPTYTVKHQIMFGTQRDTQLRYKNDVSGIQCNNVDAAGVNHPIFLQDFDLDGKDDIVTACGTNFEDLYVSQSQGDGNFVGLAQGLPSSSAALHATINSVTSGGRGSCAACFSRPAPIMIDVNGDSLQDTVTCKDQYTLQLWLRKPPAVPPPATPTAQPDFETAITLDAPPAPAPGGGAHPPPPPPRPMLPLCAGANPTYSKTFDIDGDGTPDLMVRGPGGWVVLRYAPNDAEPLSWQPVTFPDIGGTNGSAGGALTLGDFNGDGLADIANTNDPNQYVIWMNTGGTVFSPIRLANPKLAPASDARYKRRRIAALDYNADGRTDLFENWEWIDGDINTFYALYDKNYSLTPNSRYDLLTPTEAEDAIWINPWGYPQPMPWGFADDFDGDGNTDLLAGQVLYGKGASNLLLSTVEDGLGNITTVDYDDSAYGTDERCSGMQWPETCLQRVHGLVSRHTEGARAANGDPITERSYVYHYTNAHVNVTGEGWLGFDRRTVDAYVGIFNPTTSYSLNTTTIDYEPVARYKPDGTLLAGATPPYVYPLAGLPRTVTVDHHVPPTTDNTLPPLRDSDYEQRTQITNEWQVKLSANSRPFPFLGTRVTKTYDRPVSGGFIGGDSHLPFDFYGAQLTDCDVHNLPDGFGNVTNSVEYCQHTEGGAIETTVTNRGYVPDDAWPTPNLHTVEITSIVPTLNPPSQTQSYTINYEGGLVHDVTRNATGTATSAEQQHTTIYTRNDYGNVLTAQEQVPGELDHLTTFTYDSQDLFPRTITAGGQGGQTTTLQFDAGFGVPLTVVDPNGIVISSAAYDLFGRLVLSQNPTGLAITTFSAGSAVNTPLGPILPRIVVTTDRQGSDGTPGGGGSVEIDSHGREIRTTGIGYGGVTLAQETSYDSLGLVRSRSMPHPASVTDGPVEQFDYDGLQRLTLLTHADGKSRRIEYASVASLKGPLRNWIPTQIPNVPVGIVRTIDEENRENVAVTDYRGRLVRSIDGENAPLAEAGSGFASSNYYYGAFGNLGWMEDNRGIGSGTLTDAYGRLLARLDPDTGVVNYTYNGFDQLKTSTDFANHSRSYTYDGLGRLRVLDDGAQGATHWDFDQGANALGRLSETTSSTGQRVHYSYEPASASTNRGLLNGMTYTIDGLDYSVGLEYDDLGRTQRIHYPTRGNQAPIVAQYGYEPMSGSLQSLSEVGSGTAKPLWQINEVKQGQLIQKETFGNGTATSSYSYNPTRSWLEGIETKLGSTLIQSLTLTHYDNGLVHDRIDALGTSRSYDYDLLNRLKKETSTGPSGPMGTNDYTYDDIGNIKLRGGSESFYTGTKPHLLESVNGNGYLYDANGNVSFRMGVDIPGGQQTLHYTPFNLPDQITTGTGPAPQITQLEYSAGEERVVRRDPGVTHRYAASLYEHTVDTSGASETTLEERFRLFAGDRAIGEIVRKGGTDKTLYFHADNLGSIDTISDGIDSFKQQFDPFGAKRDAPNPALTRSGFTGHDSEDDLGLIDMKGRFYDPLAARFVSPDPQLQAPFWSQGQNRYSYVYNNPVNNTDPSGFRVADWIGYAIDGTIGGGTVGGLVVGILGNTAGTSVSAGSAASSAASPAISSAAGSAGPGGAMAGSLGGPIAGIGGLALANIATTFIVPALGGPSLDGSLPGGFAHTVATPSSAHRPIAAGASSWMASTQSSAPLDPCPGAGAPAQAQYIGAGLRDYNPIYMIFGKFAEKAIVADYIEKNPGSVVFSNRWVSTIARLLGNKTPSLQSLPDLFNRSTGDLYEIKSAGNEAEALSQALRYVTQLTTRGVPAHLGVATASGTVKVWGYTVDYWSPEPGVIVYERFFFRGPGLNLNEVPVYALPWLMRELMKFAPAVL